MARNVCPWIDGRAWGPEWAHAHRRGQRAKGSLAWLQRLAPVHTLDTHTGCVNSLAWNATGQLLLSGSDDHRLVVSRAWQRKVVANVLTAHRANIFSARFLPGTGDQQLVSCAGDGVLAFTHLERPQSTWDCLFSCHHGTAYQMLTLPGDPHTFLSCGEDATVRWFDLRIKTRCPKPACREDVLIAGRDPITSIAIDPVFPFRLAVGASDSAVRLFDRRMLGTRSTGQTPERSLDGLLARFVVPELAGQHRRITAVDFRPDGREVLASYSSDYVYIFDPEDHDATNARRLFVGTQAAPRDESKPKRGKSPPPMKRLRLRGDWSDTGPNARPERGAATAGESHVVPTSERSSATVPQHRPLSLLARERRSGANAVQSNLMQRMTDALSRMLNDPSTRRAMRALDHDRERILAATQRVNLDERESDGASLSPDSDASRAASTPNREGDPSNQESGSNVESSSLNVARATLHESEILLSEQESSSEGLGADPPSPGGDLQDAAASASIAGEDTAQVPEFNLRYGYRGTDTSTISIQRPSSPAEYVTDLPGPSQVVTDPGNCSRNPITGQRQRRRGVSGPPTGASVADPSDESQDLVEFEEEAGNSGSSDDEEAVNEKIKHNSITKRAIRQPKMLQKFVGHRNSRTMIKEATWWGNDFVLSGSDCGHVFGWERESGKLVLLLEADRHVVNCIQPHPFDPILATSGIDYNVKIWAPSGEDSSFNQEVADSLVRRNEVMLEETRDTITVPAALMIRMLASLNQIRRAGRILPQVLERSSNVTEDEFVRSVAPREDPVSNPEEPVVERNAEVEIMDSDDDSDM